MSIKGSDITNLEGRTPIDVGNVQVTMFKEGPKWRIKVGVFGSPDMYQMRAGCTAIVHPEEFPGAAKLIDAVGRIAAQLAKVVEKKTQGKFDACIDETDAYKGAVELLGECMIELKASGQM